MPSDEEFEALRTRVGDLEGQVSEARGRSSPSAEQIQDYVKVRNALVGKPVDLTAGEIRNYGKVRDFLLDEFAALSIPTCRAGPHRKDDDDRGAVDRMGDLGR